MYEEGEEDSSILTVILRVIEVLFDEIWLLVTMLLTVRGIGKGMLHEMQQTGDRLSL